MALTPEIETQILRYYHAEHWPIGTIATQLHVHRDSVARVLSQQVSTPAIKNSLETRARSSASRDTAVSGLV